MIRKISIYSSYLLFFSLSFFYNSVKGQNATINISAVDVDFETILKEISKQSGYTYQLDCKKISKRQKFFINANNIGVQDILKQCLDGSKLNFEIIGNKIIIYEGKKRQEQQKIQVLTQTIKGTVKDIESKKILAGANIVILNTLPTLGTNTDEKGKFRLENVPLGRFSIKVSFVGFTDVIIPEILVGSAKEIILNIELTESVQDLDQVVIKSDKERPLNDMALVSARSFSVDETKRYASSYSDPARMALCYAGVATTDDFMNEIIIRGNSPQYLLWRIEGIEVPSPNHFTDGGLSGGAISILSSNVIARSDFLTGAFPAEYGNALSGVFDIFLRNGNNETSEVAVQAGTLGLDFAAEGPIKKGYSGSYLFNYRYSTLAFLNAIKLDFLDDNAPNYQDLSFKLHLPAKRFGRFSIWGVGGISYDGTENSTDSTDLNPTKIIFREYWADYMMALGLSHTIFPNNSSYIKSTFALTKYGSVNLVDTLAFQDNYTNVFQKELYNTTYRAAIIYNNKFNKWINFRTGANFNYSVYNYFFDASTVQRNKYVFLNSEGETFLYNFYAQAKFKFNKKLTFSAGLNYMYFDLNKYFSFEPRFAFQWNFAPKQTISLGYGLHGRHEPLVVYFKEYIQPDSSFRQLNSTLDLPNAHHFIGTYSNNLAKNLFLKFEAYYQSLPNYYVASDPNYTFSAANSYTDFSVPLSNNGRGINYGIELTLEKYFTNNYYFMITSSLFKSEYQASNKLWYNTIYDLGHIYNLVAGKEFNVGKNKNNVLGSNIRISWTGGKRDTPIKIEQSIAKGYTVYNELRRNELQYPDYFRIDLSLNYRINKKKTAHIFSLDLQNITNRKNIAYKYYNPSLKNLTIQNQAGLIPVFNYRLEF